MLKRPKEVWAPTHPRVQMNKCVLEYVLIAESILGRYLTKDEVVLHKNGDVHDNSPENLMVFATRTDMSRYMKTRVAVLTETGAYIAPKLDKKNNSCPICGELTSETFCSEKCYRFSLRKVKKRPSKDTLEALTTTMPFTQIGEMYGVSDNAVRKWCKIYGIEHRKKDMVYLNDEK